MASEEAEAAAPSAFEVWNDYDPSMRFVTAYPMTAAQGTESSTIAYFAFEPGQHSGLHSDDAEELIYVADGEGEVFVSGIQRRLEAGGFVTSRRASSTTSTPTATSPCGCCRSTRARASRAGTRRSCCRSTTTSSRRTWPCRARCRSSRSSTSTICRRASPSSSAVAGGRRPSRRRARGRGAAGRGSTGSSIEVEMAVVTMMRFAGDPDELFAKVRDHVDPVTARLSPEARPHLEHRRADGRRDPRHQPVGAARRAARRWPRSRRCSRRSARAGLPRPEVEVFEVLTHHVGRSGR